MDQVERDRVAAGLTLYGEGRGEPVEGQVAIVWSFVHRARATNINGGHRWWGGPDLESVCRYPMQYSCWNAGDPNGHVLGVAFDCLVADPPRPVIVSDIVGLGHAGFDLAAYVRCRAVVLDVLEGRAPDPFAGAKLFGATHYARLEIERPWMTAAGVVEVGRRGPHKFFAGVL